MCVCNDKRALVFSFPAARRASARHHQNETNVTRGKVMGGRVGGAEMVYGTVEKPHSILVCSDTAQNVKTIFTRL